MDTRHGYGVSQVEGTPFYSDWFLTEQHGYAGHGGDKDLEEKRFFFNKMFKVGRMTFSWNRGLPLEVGFQIAGAMGADASIRDWIMIESVSQGWRTDSTAMFTE